MRIILFILQKEFLQIFRNKAMLPIIFVMPIVQLLVLSFAATFEVKNTRISLIDEDRSVTSRHLVESLEASATSLLRITPFPPRRPMTRCCGAQRR